MKKNLSFLLALITIPFIMHAQETNLNTDAVKAATKTVDAAVDTTHKSPWIIKNKFVLTAEEAYYKNWTKDGFNSLAFTAIFLGKYNYITDENKWENLVDLAYGLIAQDLDGDGAIDKTQHPRKTDDKWHLMSSYSRKAFRSWNYNATVDFLSQFSETYKEDSILMANAFAPAYILTALGATYQKYGLTALLSPITGKTTLVTDNRLSQAGAFGVVPGDKALFELGAYVKVAYSKEVFTNITLDTKLELFYDYRTTLFKDTYVNWELLMNMKVNKFLSAFFAMQTIYDRKVIDNLQFKQKLGLMISLDF